MSTMLPRLLSPQKRRIYPNARTGAGIDNAGKIVRAQRDGLEPGQADTTTWDALRKFGWEIYDGPAVTDERGYIVCGSDPAEGL